ncbi:hypothetical protein H6A24_00530 [Bacteroides caecicola]|uniref:Uncharacterized protein n=1 Tax=Bacteroides caecicola TaxID=1462569 RepID=A0ABS2F440_9BACE|nr:hypothetical protein [Bacteroides caecicola]MBM6805002.1 hypothetical protein [Bacteroides caecicola]
MDELIINNITAVQQEAIWWFLPVIFWALIGGVGGAIIGCIIGSIWDACTKKDIGMAVLGMRMSGKTLWYNFLTNDSRIGTTSSTEKVRSFKMDFSNGRSVTVKQGMDIGGSEINVQLFYEELIKENDVVLFLFNSFEYLNNLQYEREVNGRMAFIASKWDEHHPDKELSKCIFVIATYADKLIDKEKGWKDIVDRMSKRSFRNMIKQHLLLVNMTDKKQVEIMKEKIFGE